MIDLINTTYALSLMIIILVFVLKKIASAEKAEDNDPNNLNIDDRIKKIKYQLDDFPAQDDGENAENKNSNEELSMDKLYRNSIDEDLKSFNKKIIKKTNLLAKCYRKEVEYYIKYIVYIEAKLQKYKKKNKELETQLGIVSPQKNKSRCEIN